ncbi:precorrin-3B C(17)-methyltransferase [Shewanella youngdeokensis]|uniref:Precorrin-3B C(17)-methyltransferase n=1 Tax=Shewanella youngdeokensis TaxID=2999068 RepID=A0ABZ0K453_9GAMM|nr:precorrin-3B C(17)-methyltransferase [Shewanella sp. DAU334]
MTGKLTIVGIGPGSESLLTPMASKALTDAQLVVGYKPYIDSLGFVLTDQNVVANGMTSEVARARVAVEKALAGERVAVVSSGDAGIYAMGSLVYEMLAFYDWKPTDPLEVVMVPGITAAISCASLVGTPLGHDSCTISLSDLLTPWDLIERRIAAAAAADFAITFYNPRSRRRQQHIITAQKILLEHRDASTPVAIVKDAYRDEQLITLSTLGEFTDCEFGMTAAVIIGNSQSYMYGDKIITPRGYNHKYDYQDGGVKAGQQRGRSLNTAVGEA